MSDYLKPYLIKFFCGAMGSFLIVAFRDLPALPGLSHLGYLAIRLAFIAIGGALTILWQVGDENVWRSLYFGLTWPALISVVTLAR